MQEKLLVISKPYLMELYTVEQPIFNIMALS